MKLLELIAKAIALHKEVGDVEVVFGDCNQMHKADGIETVIIEDLGEFFLTDVHPDDNAERDEEDRLEINAVIVF